MRPFLRYTLARLTILAATYLVLLLVGQLFLELTELTNLLVLLAALVVSSIISVFALAGMREDLARRVQDRAQAMSARIEESRRAEDAD